MILLGVKSYALESATNDFAFAVGPETMIQELDEREKQKAPELGREFEP